MNFLMPGNLQALMGRFGGQRQPGMGQRTMQPGNPMPIDNGLSQGEGRGPRGPIGGPMNGMMGGMNSNFIMRPGLQPGMQPSIPMPAFSPISPSSNVIDRYLPPQQNMGMGVMNPNRRMY